MNGVDDKLLRVNQVLDIDKIEVFEERFVLLAWQGLSEIGRASCRERV